MKKLLTIMVVSVLATWMVSCGEPDYPVPTPSVVVATARVIPVNTVAGRDTIIATLDNNVSAPLQYGSGANANKNIKFGQAVSYITIPAGPNRLLEYLNVKNDTTFVTDRFSVVSSTNYTSIFYKNVAASNGKVTYGVRRLTDVLTTPDPGTARVRFFNFLYDTVGVTPPQLKLTNVGGATTYFSARSYAAVSSGSTNFGDFSVLTSGTADYEIRDADNNVLLTKSLNFVSKGIYTVIVRGLVDGTGPNAIEVTVLTH